jgi:hypothetical protein
VSSSQSGQTCLAFREFLLFFQDFCVRIHREVRLLRVPKSIERLLTFQTKLFAFSTGFSLFTFCPSFRHTNPAPKAVLESKQVTESSFHGVGLNPSCKETQNCPAGKPNPSLT